MATIYKRGPQAFFHKLLGKQRNRPDRHTAPFTDSLVYLQDARRGAQRLPGAHRPPGASACRGTGGTPFMSVTVGLVPDFPTEARMRTEVLHVNLEPAPGCRAVLPESAVALE